MDSVRLRSVSLPCEHRVSNIAEIWERNKELLYRVSLRLNRGNVPDSEDLLSQSLLKILSNETCFIENINNPIAFFIDIIRKEYISIYRKKMRMVKIYDYSVDVSDPGFHPPPDVSSPQFDHVAGKEKMRVLAEGLATLSGPQKEALEMRFLEERDYRDIAERLSISSALARKRVQLARDKIRMFFDPVDA